ENQTDRHRYDGLVAPAPGRRECASRVRSRPESGRRGCRSRARRCAYRGELWAHTDREPGRPEPHARPLRQRHPYGPWRPLWLVQYYRGKVSLNRPFVRAWPVTACLLATLVWIVVQALPLPAGALGLLSPRALEIHSATHSYPSLSLDVYATRQAALQTLAY